MLISKYKWSLSQNKKVGPQQKKPFLAKNKNKNNTMKRLFSRVFLGFNSGKTGIFSGKGILLGCFLLFSLFLAISISFFVFFGKEVEAAAGINKQINFQGKVVNSNGTNVSNGNYDFEFKIYDAAAAGSTLWTETRTAGNQVTVTNGIFRVALGSVTALPGSIDFNTDNIYLGINFNSDGEMTPRVRFTAVPQAFNAEKVSGLTVTNTTGTLTIPDTKVISFADSFTTSGAFGLTLTVSNTTNATLPSGTITLADLATSQTFTNKIIGTTGLSFSGATTDVATVSNEDFTVAPNGTGDVILTLGNTGQFAVNATPTGDTSQDSFKLTLNPTITGSTATLQGLVISQSDNANTGVYDSLLKLEDLKTPETTTNGLFIDHNAASGTLSRAVNITNTAGTLSTGVYFSGTIPTGIDFDAADVTRELVLENGEAIHNQSDGIITLEDGGGTDYATLSSTSAAFAGDLTVTGGDINGANSDSIDVAEAADATFTFIRNTSGTVTLIGADDTGPADTVYDTTGAGAITIGSADVTAITLSTDGTGDGTDVVLPTGAVSSSEILNSTIDQNDLNTQGTDTDEFCLTRESTSGAPLEWQSCGAGGATAWNDIGDPTGAGSITFGDGETSTFVYTHSGASDQNAFIWDVDQADNASVVDDLDVIRLDLTSESGDTGDTFDGIVINWENGTANTVFDSGLKINNAETTASTLTDAIIVTSTGVDNGVVDAIDVSDSNITNGINLGANNLILNGDTINDFTGNGLTASSNVLTAQTATSADALSSTTSSGSGLEVLPTGIAMLQGCANNQVLKWNEGSDVWNCGSDRGTSHSRLGVNYTNATASFTTITDGDDDLDADITFAVGTNETWIFEAVLYINSPTLADHKLQVTAPASSTCVVGFENSEDTVNVGNIGCATTSGILNSPAAAYDVLRVNGTIVTAGTSGQVSIQYGQQAASGTSTIALGSYINAYKISGADLAEVYYTNESGVDPGTIVSLDPRRTAGVIKTAKAYDDSAVGVVSTQPGLVIGDAKDRGKGSPVMLALSGRVPVNVSAENGEIKPGDYLTSSSTPGVAMKATRAGRVIGQAMQGYAGKDVGSVVMFINNTYTQGLGIQDLAAEKAKNTSKSPSAKAEDFGKQALAYLLSSQKNAGTSLNMSELLTDRVSSAVEVITPRVVVETLEVSKIHSLNTDGTFTFVRNDDGKVVIMGADGKGAADTVFDTTGAGTITIGSGDVKYIRLLTDGSNNVLLPEGAVDGTEILNGSITAADIDHAIAGKGLQFVAGSAEVLAVAVISIDDGAGLTESNSGLEFGGKDGNQFGLLQGCKDGQTLKWNDEKGVWQCADDKLAAAAAQSAPVEPDQDTAPTVTPTPDSAATPVKTDPDVGAPVASFEPSSAVTFSDKGSELTNFTATADIWDGEQAYVSLHGAGSSVLVAVTLSGEANDDEVQNPVFTVHRKAGGDSASCGDYQVGVPFAGSSTNANGQVWSASASFVDVGPFTENARVSYTVCTSKLGFGDSEVDTIHMNLVEVGR